MLLMSRVLVMNLWLIELMTSYVGIRLGRRDHLPGLFLTSPSLRVHVVPLQKADCTLNNGYFLLFYISFRIRRLG